MLGTGIPVDAQAIVCAAVIAMLVPFFTDVVGLLGSLGFWPLTVFLPVQMHIAQTGNALAVAYSPCAFAWSSIRC